MKIVGLILAGGRSSRMGGNPKGLISLAGSTLLEQVIERLKPQVDTLLINANYPYANEQYAVIPDMLPDFPGPLTGIVSAFDYLDKIHSDADAIAVVPCDGPFLPKNLVSALVNDMAERDVTSIRYAGEPQPTFGLWRRCVAEKASHSLQQQGGLKALMRQLNTGWVDWPVTAINPFFNINTAADMEKAKELIQ